MGGKLVNLACILQHLLKNILLICIRYLLDSIWYLAYVHSLQCGHSTSNFLTLKSAHHSAKYSVRLLKISAERLHLLPGSCRSGRTCSTPEVPGAPCPPGKLSTDQCAQHRTKHTKINSDFFYEDPQMRQWPEETARGWSRSGGSAWGHQLNQTRAKLTRLSSTPWFQPLSVKYVHNMANTTV